MNEIRYKIEVDGARETQQVLQGLRKDAAETTKATNAARQATATAATAPGGNNAATAEQAVITQRKRAVAQYETWRRGEEARTARERDAHLRAGVRAEQQAATSRMQTIREFGTRALAIYQSVSARASALSGAFGGRSREAMLGENMNFGASLVRFSADTGINRSTAQRSILSAARASGLDPSAVLAGLGAGADVAGDAGGAALTRHATPIARAAAALGTDVSTIAAPLGQALNRGMGEDAIQRFLDRFVATATASKIAPEELSGRLGGAIANMSTLTGAGGEDAVLRTMQLQGVVAGAFSGAGRQAGQKYDQVMGMLGDTGFQRRLQRTTGITGTVDNRPGGVMADPLQTLQTMQASGALVTTEQFARLGGSQENGLALQTLIAGMRNPANAAIQDAMNVSGTAGAAYTNEVMGGLQQVAGYGNQADQMAGFIENGQDFARYADTMADAVDGLNSRFPLATEGVENFTGAMEKMITLLGLGGMGAGAAGGAGAAAGLGGGAAAGGGGGVIATVTGGVTAAGAATAAGVAAGAVGLGMLADRAHTNYVNEQNYQETGGAVGLMERRQAAALEQRQRSSVGQGAISWLPGGSGGSPPAPGHPVAVPAPHAAHVAPASTGGSNAGGFLGGGAPAAAPASGGSNGGGRPVAVAFDRASMDAFANTIATRMNAAQGRGESERGR